MSDISTYLTIGVFFNVVIFTTGVWIGRQDFVQRGVCENVSTYLIVGFIFAYTLFLTGIGLGTGFYETYNHTGPTMRARVLQTLVELPPEERSNAALDMCFFVVGSGSWLAGAAEGLEANEEVLKHLERKIKDPLFLQKKWKFLQPDDRVKIGRGNTPGDDEILESGSGISPDQSDDCDLSEDRKKIIKRVEAFFEARNNPKPQLSLAEKVRASMDKIFGHFQWYRKATEQEKLIVFEDSNMLAGDGGDLDLEKGNAAAVL